MIKNDTMIKLGYILCFVFCGLLFMQCSQNKPSGVIDNADYTNQTNTLKVDYQNNPDTSLLQILSFSNIRKSGYGLLLNIDNSFSKSDIDTLKYKFQKLDINAIHSYDVVSVNKLPNHIKVALEDAKFIWILDESNIEIESIPLGITISEVQAKRDDKLLIVIF